MATAPAMATRFFWPNDSMWVGRSARSAMRRAASASSTRSRVSASDRPKLRGPNDTSSATEGANS